MKRMILILLLFALPGFTQRKPEPPRYQQKWLLVTWAGLAAGMHASIERDVSSTIRARDTIRNAGGQPFERNSLAAPYFNNGGKLRGMAHLGGLGLDALSLAMIKSKKPALVGMFWIPQAMVIIACNAAASRNERLTRRWEIKIPIR